MKSPTHRCLCASRTDYFFRLLLQHGEAGGPSLVFRPARMTLTGLNPAQLRTAKAKEALGRSNFSGILKGKRRPQSSTPQKDYHIALAPERHEALLDEREPAVLGQCLVSALARWQQRQQADGASASTSATASGDLRLFGVALHEPRPALPRPHETLGAMLAAG